MLIESIVVVCLLLPYFIQMEYWRKQWLREPVFKENNIEVKVLISVIIPYRNESKHLIQLIKSLECQNYNNWELILVNDHSEDDSAQICSSNTGNFNVPVHIVDNKGRGKKEALKTGAFIAKGDIIVSTDADCIVQKNWLSHINSFYTETKAVLIIGSVQYYSQTNNWLSNLQLSEMTALQITGAAAAISGKPIMMNGANMACERTFYLNANLKNQLASGDDMFLLEEAKKHCVRIAYLKSPDSVVYTRLEESFAEVLSQKARWASKAKAYSDRDIIRGGLFIFLVNITVLVLLIASFINPLFSTILIGVICAKLVSDVRVLNVGFQYFNNTICMRDLLIGILLYPFYMLLVLFYPLFWPIKWKNRRI